LRVLLIGGAGYIGSALSHRLLDRGHEAVVYDDLSTGFREAVPAGVVLVEGDTGNSALLATTIKQHGIDAAIHLAAHVRVEESVANPAKYYANNTVKALGVFETLARAGVRDVVFSSTAAVYGAPEGNPIAESAPLTPVNPYGGSKLASEFILKDLAAAHGLRATVLRYFNVAGADPKGRVGLATVGATHLLKIAVEAATGQRAKIDVFGTDYPTPDGSCIRDFIHVSDLAQAHRAALSYLRNGGNSVTLNCGYGRGYSVLETIEAVRRVSMRNFAVQYAPRRPGDIMTMVADTSRIRSTLDWTPQFDDLQTIAIHALAWEQKLFRDRGGPPQQAESA